MEIEDASELIFREALRRLGPGRKLDTEALQRKMAEVLQEQGETIFAQLSQEARERLRREGWRIQEQTARLERINEAIQYGRSLIANYNVETLAELPPEERLEFARLWADATGGTKFGEN